MPADFPAYAASEGNLKLRKTWMAQERIEDLDDGFDVGVCLRGHGGW